MSDLCRVVVAVFGLSMLSAFAPASAQPTGQEIERQHRARVDSLKELVKTQDEFAYAIHTLILPPGALPSYNFPVPVARVRYQAVPFFDFDSSQPRKEAATVTEQLAKQFRNDRSLARVAVVGHTDSVGSDDYNYQLSLRRALAVANLLRLYGVVSDKIIVIGLGESFPIASNSSEQGRASNRRVEFFLSSLPNAIAPSIRNTEVNPSLRNDHDAECAREPAPETCGQTTVRKFPVQGLTSGGQLRPTGEEISVDDKPRFPVREVPERVHVPTDVEIRPHIPN